ncbi:hypothetical protein C8R45DRAFT_95759 [Mycena sanguinolenta]|nr:hypothetical protein C8R45DRAFT_95759 [Mycena sanguinolenta]
MRVRRPDDGAELLLSPDIPPSADSSSPRRLYSPLCSSRHLLTPRRLLGRLYPFFLQWHALVASIISFRAIYPGASLFSLTVDVSRQICIYPFIPFFFLFLLHFDPC